MEYTKDTDYLEIKIITYSNLDALSLLYKRVSMNTHSKRDITVTLKKGIEEAVQRYAYRDAFDFGE